MNAKSRTKQKCTAQHVAAVAAKERRMNLSARPKYVKTKKIGSILKITLVTGTGKIPRADAGEPLTTLILEVELFVALTASHLD